jgi:galactokinase/mevalonate kinase-like predicted kinase
VLANTNITKEGAKDLAAAANDCWEAILKKDLPAFGNAFLASYQAQIAMFPNMVDATIQAIIDQYAPKSMGYKLSGAGGGGYLILISDKAIENAIQIKIRRKNLM